MTVREIVIEKLKAMGAAGLCNPDEECGCGLDDFLPCGEMNMECEPARKIPCPGNDPLDETQCENAEYGCSHHYVRIADPEPQGE